MFKKTKEELLKAKEKADAELNEQLAREKAEHRAKQEVEVRRKRDSMRYKSQCELYKINLDSGYRLIALLEWLQTHPGRVLVTVDNRGVPKHTVVSYGELVKLFRLEKLIAHLNELDTKGITFEEFLSGD